MARPLGSSMEFDVKKESHAKRKKKLKQTNASDHLVQYRFKIREGSSEGIRKTMEEGRIKINMRCGQSLGGCNLTEW